jgi:hypothetical protein
MLWFGAASSKRDGALAWLPAGTATPLTSAETPFQTKARENFAASKNRDVSTVSLRDVMESTEGVQGWAFVGVDVSSSGNLNRAMARELEKPQHAHVAKFVKYLPPHIAEKFRMAWASTPVRGFEFLEESKTSITYTKNTQGKDREWLTLGGLAKAFGDPNGEEEKELAWKWATACWHTEDADVEWCKWSDWLGVWKYAYESDKERDEDGEQHTNESKQSNKTNCWEAAANEHKALLNFAQNKGVKLNTISIQMVKDSPLGYEGWLRFGEPRVGGRPKIAVHGASSSVAVSPKRRVLRTSSSDATAATGADDMPRKKKPRKKKKDKANTSAEAEVDEAGNDNSKRKRKSRSRCPPR